MVLKVGIAMATTTPATASAINNSVMVKPICLNGIAFLSCCLFMNRKGNKANWELVGYESKLPLMVKLKAVYIYMRELKKRINKLF